MKFFIKILEYNDTFKIKLIKTIREEFNFSLMFAKLVVDEHATDLSKYFNSLDEANTCSIKLQQVGCVVSIYSSSSL